MRVLLNGCMLSILCTQASISGIAAPISDPIGDTFGNFDFGRPPIDVVAVNAAYTGTVLTFNVSFNGLISPPTSEAANSVYGYIDLDVDQDPFTGYTALVNQYGPAPELSLGIEYFIDLSSEQIHGGLVDVYDAAFVLAGEHVGTVPVSFGPTWLSVSLPLTMIADDGLVNYGWIVGTQIQPTDRAPNGMIPGSSSSQVPEPSCLWFVCVPLTGFALILRARK